MAPILIAAATSAIAGYFIGEKTRCAVCASKFTLNEHCLICDRLVCGSCGKDYGAVEYRGTVIQKAGRCCDEHRGLMESLLSRRRQKIDADIAEKEAEAARRAQAEAYVEKVVLWSKNYGGHASPGPRLHKSIRTPFYRSQDEARHELKLMAVLNDCYAVHRVTLVEETREDGNYKYRVWALEGVI